MVWCFVWQDYILYAVLYVMMYTPVIMLQAGMSFADLQFIRDLDDQVWLVWRRSGIEQCIARHTARQTSSVCMVIVVHTTNLLLSFSMVAVILLYICRVTQTSQCSWSAQTQHESLLAMLHSSHRLLMRGESCSTTLIWGAQEAHEGCSIPLPNICTEALRLTNLLTTQHKVLYDATRTDLSSFPLNCVDRTSRVCCSKMSPCMLRMLSSRTCTDMTHASSKLMNSHRI